MDGIDWIRLLYLYPTTITEDMLDAMAECHKVVSTSIFRSSTPQTTS